MSYKVFVAEDEPPLLRNLVKNIQRLGSEYEVVGQAFDGEQAYEEMMRLRPDILITDIRMPILDGLGLIKKLKSCGLNIHCIITTGYDEFEYAQRAIRLGVENYLLKPLSFDKLAEALGQLEAKLIELRHQQSLNIFNKVINFNADASMLERLESDRYEISFICINNPLTHFRGSEEYLYKIHHLMWDLNFDELLQNRLINNKHKYWILDGKFPNEKIVILRPDKQSEQRLHTFANDILEKLVGGEDYATIAFEPFDIQKNQLAAAVHKLRQFILERAVVGASQVLTDTQANAAGADAVILRPELEKKLTLFSRSGKAELIQRELIQQFEAWNTRSVTKRMLESHFTQVIRICYHNSEIMRERPLSHFEEKLDEVFLLCNRMDLLLAEFLSMIPALLKPDGQAEADTDLQKYERMAEKVMEYLSNHLDQKISLQETAEIFGVTESFLSKLFKKMTGNSLIDYLIKLRIDKAKTYMKDYPEIMLKDIAEMTGFSDQYYFSRVFKSITGKTPSEYRLVLCTNGQPAAD
ncbi:response regulator [Cohnella sp. GCM10012308]|uniref:response regulator n=1 Tax=Cohnella sp. GCM10012308 TaxID=3317329 RepID=UPI0036216883